MKYLLIIACFLTGCITDNEETKPPIAITVPSIMGTYYYEEAGFKITITFDADFTFTGVNEMVGMQAQIYSGKWNRLPNSLCLEDECGELRNISNAGFDWHDGTDWFYWKKL